MRGQGLQGQWQQAGQQANKKRRTIEESEKILKKWILKTLKSCIFLWTLTGIYYTTIRTKKGDFKPPQFYIITLNKMGKMEDLKINEFERLDSVDAGDLITQTDEELEKLIQEQAKKGEEGQNSQKN